MGIGRWVENRIKEARLRKVERAVFGAAGFEVTKIFSHTSRAELAKLYELALLAAPGTAALEIGSYLGASSCYIAAAMRERGGKLYCVDTWNNETMNEGERDTMAEFAANTKAFGSTIVPIRKRSETLVREDVRSQIGFVFIDGDHSYEACRQDFEIVKDWLPANGIVAFHDAIYPLKPANFPGVQRVIGAAMASGEWQFGSPPEESLCWLKRAPGWLGQPG